MTNMRANFAWQALGVVVLVTTLSSDARAHGPAPSPLNILAFDAGEPTVVGTSIGLSRRTQTGFEYICPSAWNEGEDAFDRPIPVAAVANAVTIVLGRPHLMRSEQRGCQLTPLRGDLEGRGADALDVATIYAGVTPATFALLMDDGLAGTSVWTASPLASFAPLLDAEVPLQSLGRNAERIVAAGVDRRDDERALALVVGPRLGPLEVTRLPASVLPAGAETLSSVRVRLVEEDALWLVVATAEGFHLWRAQEDEDAGFVVEEIVRSEGAVHGPVQLCGTTAYATDGLLRFVDAETAECDPQPLADLDIRCLGQTRGVPYACASFQLFELSADAGELSATNLFAMPDLSGPDLSCVETEEERDRCTAVWTHFGAEAGLLEPAPEGEPAREPEPAPEPEPTSCACATCQQRPAFAWAVAFGLLAAFGRRRRESAR